MCAMNCNLCAICVLTNKKTSSTTYHTMHTHSSLNYLWQYNTYILFLRYSKYGFYELSVENEDSLIRMNGSRNAYNTTKNTFYEKQVYLSSFSTALKKMIILMLKEVH